MIKRTSNRELKHPILKNVEYGSVTKNGKRVLEIPGSEIESLSWRDFTIYIGKKLPPGKYGFTIKFKNDAKLYSGTTRAVTLDPVDIKKDNFIQDQLNELKKIIATQSAGGSNETVVLILKQGYEMQIQFLNRQIELLEKNNKNLEDEIDEVEDDLDECQNKLKEALSKSEYTQYIPGALKLLQAKFGGGKAVSLENSDQSDIPTEILQILGTVDYSKIDPESMQKIIEGLRNYISLLPIKGSSV